MGEVYFISDPHFGHRNLILGETQWDENKRSKCRNFNSLQEHDELLIDNINKYVKAKDTLYCLGDWSFGGIDNIGLYRRRLYVETIHLILGNHDHHIAKKNSLVSGYFNSVNLAYDAHTERRGINGIPMYLSHYKHFSWPKSHKGTVHLYGHSHGSVEAYQIGKSMDVGVDSAKILLGEYRPFHFDEVMYFMDKREVNSIVLNKTS